MPVLALGVSYRRAPVELLERLAFTDEEYPKAYRRLAESEAVTESGILSTCNRVEVYGEVESFHAGFLDLKRFLSQSRELPPEEFAEPLYSHYEDDAARHLLSVAAGLDSMVLGEPQILSQVRQAYHVAEAERATGPILQRLFRAAIRTGRRVRADTAVGASPAAFVETGVALAARELGGIEGRPVAVVGAGSMAAMAVKHLQAVESGPIRVANRSVERARRLASRASGEGHGLDALVSVLVHADLVVSCTGSAGSLIGTGDVREALSRRGGRSLFLVDLAVPRDVEPEVGTLPGVRLVDIDDLKEALKATGAEASGELQAARAIVAEEAGKFTAWRRSARLAPLIQALLDRGARIQAAELARRASQLGELSDREWATVEALAGGIVAKLLHDPIVKIKEHSGAGGDSFARTVAELFGIEFHPGA